MMQETYYTLAGTKTSWGSATSCREYQCEGTHIHIHIHVVYKIHICIFSCVCEVWKKMARRFSAIYFVWRPKPIIKFIIYALLLEIILRLVGSINSRELPSCQRNRDYMWAYVSRGNVNKKARS